MARLTRDNVELFSVGTWLYSADRTMANGKSPFRVRINGHSYTWKARPHEYKLPVKFGMRACFYLTHDSPERWYTDEQEAITARSESRVVSRA
ncbi:hypothetical protein HC928_05040 [bacterium]|nr:hypothetical protein [bacterium]